MTNLDRINRIREAVKAAGAQNLVVFSSPHHSFQLINPVQVLTGFRNMGSSAAILDAAGKITLVATPAFDGARAREAVNGIEVIATDDLAGALAERLRGTAGPVAVDGLDEIPMAIVGPFKQALGNRLQSVEGLLLDAGKTKSASEIETGRRMSALAEKLFDTLLETARPGMREYELAAAIHCASAALGADDNFLLVCASQLHPSIRPPGRRVMEKGDVILAEISPGVDGVFVQICRTAVIGPASDVLQKNYDILCRSMDAGLAAAKPGTTVSEVTKKMNAVIADAGFAEYSRPPYMRVRGHGMGTISNLPGDIDGDNHTVLEEGMTFVMHPNQFLPGSGYLLCGEPVVITARGAEPMTTRFSKLMPIAV